MLFRSTESIEKSEQPALGARPPGGGSELGQFGFESFGSKGLAPAPRKLGFTN